MGRYRKFMCLKIWLTGPNFCSFLIVKSFIGFILMNLTSKWCLERRCLSCLAECNDGCALRHFRDLFDNVAKTALKYLFGVWKRY